MSYVTSASTKGGREGRAILDKAKALVEEAHQICPHSPATRNNVPVTLTVV